METGALRRGQPRKEEMARREKSVLACETVCLEPEAGLLALARREGPNDQLRLFI